MTENEAIEAIQFDLKIGGEIHSQVLRDAVGVAIQALEKQIPKKPLQKSYMVKGAVVCPICEFVVLKADGYCSHCGQHLDWSNEE